MRDLETYDGYFQANGTLKNASLLSYKFMLAHLLVQSES